MSASEGDTIVFSTSNNIETDRSIMLQKSWVYILDQSNGNYNNSQSIIDTTTLASSQKYINYKEAFLTVPLIITLTNSATGNASAMKDPAAAGTSMDYSIGLKQSYLSFIHSFSVDLNGRNVVQQTPLCSIYNNFQLLTSFSYGDIVSQGPVIGFYPDDQTAWHYNATADFSGLGVCNNDVSQALENSSGVANNFAVSNTGLFRRIQYINYDPASYTGTSNELGSTFATLQGTTQADALYRNRIFKKQATASAFGIVQIQVLGIIKLKHLHHIFSQIPLAKNLQWKLILNLNQSITKINVATGVLTATNEYLSYSGVNPLIFTNNRVGIAPTTAVKGLPPTPNYGSLQDGDLYASVYVGNRCLSATQIATNQLATSSLQSSIQLSAPWYELSPIIDSLYISNPNKTVLYNDIYQYTISGIPPATQFNQLITGGLAGVKSILLIPTFNATATSNVAAGGVPYQSIFNDGTVLAPMGHVTNMQFTVGGQNMIYSIERYQYESFQQNLYGWNSVNTGLTDGLTSGLYSYKDFNMGQPYYIADCSRGMPVELEMPRSVSIQGFNTSSFTMDYIVFIEFTNQISLNVLSGQLL